jgi:hypothetical protein
VYWLLIAYYSDYHDDNIYPYLFQTFAFMLTHSAVVDKALRVSSN